MASCTLQIVARFARARALQGIVAHKNGDLLETKRDQSSVNRFSRLHLRSWRFMRNPTDTPHRLGLHLGGRPTRVRLK